MPTNQTRVATTPPFDWRLSLHGHGWISLEPHSFDEETARFPASGAPQRLQALVGGAGRRDDGSVQGSAGVDTRLIGRQGCAESR